MTKKLNTLEVKRFLEQWVHNFGLTNDSVEDTVIFAMNRKPALKQWFHTDDIEYDPDYAVSVVQEWTNVYE
jgi:hypothetical protein